MRPPIKLELNADRLERLYQQLHRTINDHMVQGLTRENPQAETPNVIYEAIDALALVTSEVWSSLQNNVSDHSANTAKKYFRERTDLYMQQLKRRKDPGPVKPVIMN
jgi:hypothetical protein